MRNISDFPIHALSLDRKSSIPLHQQLYEILRSLLDSDQYSSGEKFFTETELIQIFDISRNTARQVLNRLSDEGFILRERGKGTTVIEPGLEQSLEKIVSFTDEMIRRGIKPETIVLSQEIKEPTPQQAKALKISAEKDLVCIKRLRLGDHLPICIEESYLVKAYLPQLSDHDYAKYPLKKALETMLNSRLDFAQQTIKAIAAPKEIGELLSIPQGAPLLYIERITYSGTIPIEFLKIFYRGDRFTLYNELAG